MVLFPGKYNGMLLLDTTIYHPIKEVEDQTNQPTFEERAFVLYQYITLLIWSWNFVLGINSSI